MERSSLLSRPTQPCSDVPGASRSAGCAQSPRLEPRLGSRSRQTAGSLLLAEALAGQSYSLEVPLQLVARASAYQIGSPAPDEPRPPSPHLALDGSSLPARPDAQQLQSLTSSSYTALHHHLRLAALLAPPAPPRIVRQPPPCRASPRGAARLRSGTEQAPRTHLCTRRLIVRLVSAPQPLPPRRKLTRSSAHRGLLPLRGRPHSRASQGDPLDDQEQQERQPGPVRPSTSTLLRFAGELTVPPRPSLLFS